MIIAGSVLVACGAGDDRSKETVTVLAAASLTGVFDTLEPLFEKDNPGTDLRFSFAGSSDLAQQIVNGAPADVFASANPKQMMTVVNARMVEGSPTNFASNLLTIAVRTGNPTGIRSFADLANPARTVVVAGPEEPCGAATAQIEKSTGITLKPLSEESDVKSILAKVEQGDADAGLLFVTDVRSARGKVAGITFPEAREATTEYPIAVLSNGPHKDLGRKFADLVLSPQGQQVLHDAGFSSP